MQTPNYEQLADAVKEVKSFQNKLAHMSDTLLEALLLTDLRGCNGRNLAALKQRLEKFNRQKRHWQS